MFHSLCYIRICVVMLVALKLLSMLMFGFAVAVLSFFQLFVWSLNCSAFAYVSLMFAFCWWLLDFEKRVMACFAKPPVSLYVFLVADAS